MTTNHIERLDPALIRPGRVDVIQLIGDATPNQARRLLCQFYSEPDAEEKINPHYAAQLAVLGDELASVVAAMGEGGRNVSMASLQGHFIRHPTANEAVQNASSLFHTM